MLDQHSSYKAVLHRHDVQLAGIIVVMAVIFSTLSKSFLSASNLISLLENYSVMAIMAAGLLVVLISGGIDISNVDLFDDEFLHDLSRKYGVSAQALVNRLKNLGYIQE